MLSEKVDEQQRYDSNGKKVPRWEAKEIEDVDVVRGPQSQTSWTTWASKASTWGTRKRSIDSSSSSRVEEKDLWLPVSLRAPLLGSIFFASISLIAVLEVLAHFSSRNDNENGGGLAFAETQEKLSTGVLFTYLYLPTIIAVIYSMVWAWVDLDVKRLEPWFQLSKPEGANAESSVLLHYQFDFLAFVPGRSGRRRHWAVLVSGATIVLVMWAIVPLQSAIFTTKTVVRKRPAPMVVTADLPSPATQVSALDYSFQNAAFAISWLGQRMPPFTTREYALRPFGPSKNYTDRLTTETWTAETQMYYTNLTCVSPVTASMTSPYYQNAWNFDDGDGCLVEDMTVPNYSEVEGFEVDNLLLYIPFWNDAVVDRALHSPNCTREKNSHKFLAVWGAPENVTDPVPDPNQASPNESIKLFSRLTALFCQPTYHTRSVLATVNASTSAVVDIKFDPDVQADVLSEEVFNATNFEYHIGTGVSPISTEPSIVGNVPDITRLEQYPRLLPFKIAWPPSPMVGFGLALATVGVEGLADPMRLQEAFENAHRVLFATAMERLMNTNNLSESFKLGQAKEGYRYDRPAAIVLVRPFSIVVETLLGLVSILTVAMWVTYNKRDNQMVTDPGSVSDLMRMIRSSQGLLHGFDDDGFVTQKSLQQRLKGHRFRIVTTASSRGLHTELEALDSERNATKLVDVPTRADAPKQFKAIRPFELTLTSAGLGFLVLSAAIGVLTAFYVQIKRNNGLEPPTDDELVLTILTNFIPTAFATLIEPCWIVLNRLLCILQPFEDLRRGNAKSQSSVKARYTSVPPQLAFWRALRAKHFLLATVCAVAFLTNVLAVSLSGLFKESPTMIPLRTISLAKSQATFNGEPNLAKNTQNGFSITFVDHFYAIIANLSGNTPLPPWVSQDYYFIPFDLLSAPAGNNTPFDMQIQSYTASTRGFGLKYDCKDLPTNKGASQEFDTAEFIMFTEAFRNETEANLTLNHILPDGSTIQCQHNQPMQSYTEGTSKLEAVQIIPTPPGIPGDDSYCNSTLISLWARSTVDTPSIDGPHTDQELNIMAVACTPIFETADFSVRVDSTGRILSANRTSEFATDFAPYGGEGITTSVMQQINNFIAPRTANQWLFRNETFARTWLSSMLFLRNASTMAWNDPASTVPEVGEVITQVAPMLRLLAAVIMGLDKKLYKAPEKDIQVPMTINVVQDRIFMEPVMFYLSVVLLGIQLVVLVALYYNRPGRFLPRLPLSIADNIAFISSSHAVQDSFDGDDSVRYGYGRFRGVDGRTHVGIEKEPLVVPLKRKNPNAPPRKRGLFGRGSDETEPNTWL